MEAEFILGSGVVVLGANPRSVSFAFGHKYPRQTNVSKRYIKPIIDHAIILPNYFRVTSHNVRLLIFRATDRFPYFPDWIRLVLWITFDFSFRLFFQFPCILCKDFHRLDYNNQYPQSPTFTYISPYNWDNSPPRYFTKYPHHTTKYHNPLTQMFHVKQSKSHYLDFRFLNFDFHQIKFHQIILSHYHIMLIHERYTHITSCLFVLTHHSHHTMNNNIHHTYIHDTHITS